MPTPQWAKATKYVEVKFEFYSEKTMQWRNFTEFSSNLRIYFVNGKICIPNWKSTKRKSGFPTYHSLTDRFLSFSTPRPSPEILGDNSKEARKNLCVFVKVQRDFFATWVRINGEWILKCEKISMKFFTARHFKRNIVNESWLMTCNTGEGIEKSPKYRNEDVKSLSSHWLLINHLSVSHTVSVAHFYI